MSESAAYEAAVRLLSRKADIIDDAWLVPTELLRTLVATIVARADADPVGDGPARYSAECADCLPPATRHGPADLAATSRPFETRADRLTWMRDHTATTGHRPTWTNEPAGPAQTEETIA